MRVFMLALMAALLATSCAHTKHEPREVASLYSFFFENDSVCEVPERLRPEINAFMKVLGVDSVDAACLSDWSRSRVVRVFSPDVDSVFRNLDGLEMSVGGIYARAENMGLDLPGMRFAAVVWGRPESIVFCDSVVLVALNHYLGASYPGYSHLEPYRRREKEPMRLVCDIAEALVATNYRYFPGEDATVLSRLLYEGALAEAKMGLASEGAAEALGYTDNEYEWLCDNEEGLWRALVSRNLLYSTLPLDADRLVAPAPHTAVLSMDAPGRAGRFLGWQIVRSYMHSHPDAELSGLLSPEFYNSPDVLRESGYTGR